MSLTREQKRHVYCTYTEIRENAEYAPALPCTGDTVQCSKGETGMGPWFDAACDFFGLMREFNRDGHVIGTHRGLLDKLHLVGCTQKETRKHFTKIEKRISRKFWRLVRERALDEYAMMISEKM